MDRVLASFVPTGPDRTVLEYRTGAVLIRA